MIFDDSSSRASPSAQPRPTLILGSSSRYRAELLARLRLPFETQSPQVDETPWPGEAPATLTERLALSKAQALIQPNRDTVVIGADQVADVDGIAIGKPGTHERARAQLRAMSGRSIIFQTAVAVVRAATGYVQVRRVPVNVRLRHLSDEEIEFYLHTEQPYDCAGSAKCETLGIALLEAITCDDPTALIGLPLIQTTALLREAGLDPLRRPPGTLFADIVKPGQHP